MIDAEFQQLLARALDSAFREDLEAAIFELYTAASPAQRDILRGLADDGFWRSKPWRNPTDYERSDLTPEQRARQTLISMSMRGIGPDYRDDLVSIALCYHSLRISGIDADAFLRQIAEMSKADFANLVLNFARREPEGKSMQAFGLQVVQTPRGPQIQFSS